MWNQMASYAWSAMGFLADVFLMFVIVMGAVSTVVVLGIAFKLIRFKAEKVRINWPDEDGDGEDAEDGEAVLSRSLTVTHTTSAPSTTALG